MIGKITALEIRFSSFARTGEALRTLGYWLLMAVAR